MTDAGQWRPTAAGAVLGMPGPPSVDPRSAGPGTLRRALVLTGKGIALVLVILAAFGNWKAAESGQTDPLPGTRSALPVACRWAGVSSVETVDSIPDVEFAFDAAVVPSDRVKAQRGIRLGQAYINTVFAGRESPTCVRVVIDAGGDNAGKAGLGTVFLFTTTRGWPRSYPSWHLERVAAHEYSHLWQQEHRRRQQRVLWFDEGVAELISYRSLIQAGVIDDKRARLSALRTARSGDNRALQTYEDTATASAYGLFYFAVEYLVSISGVESLATYYEFVEAFGDWTTAFENAFGLSHEDFYDSFEIYRSNSFRQ